MPNDPTAPQPTGQEAARPGAAERLPHRPAARRALAEAAARRAKSDCVPAERPKEIAGRDGPDPTRYGDWEINGLTSDF